LHRPRINFGFVKQPLANASPPVVVAPGRAFFQFALS